MQAVPQRRALWIETLVCLVLVAIVSLNAMRRMDYFGNPEHIRMTDASRSAFVGKNIAEGRGYTTNDLPASLIDFYAQRGKLHADEWVNADRFPFTAYAIAALYFVTQSTSEFVGIFLYNVVCFVGFLILLYRLARAIWGNRWSAMIAIALALLNPYTFVYLYLKDADMLLLTVGVMTLMYRYFNAPPESMSKKLAVAIGTLLAWLFLSRPNLGAPFVLGFGIVTLVRLRRHGKTVGFGPAFVEYLKREGVAFGVAFLWLVPFIIHSMSEWGSPLFSANNLYQLPLGTRYGMGTDTWWKYTEPGQDITLGTLVANDSASIIAKFTSSWIATIRSTITGYGIELLLAAGALAWLRRRSDVDVPSRRPLTMLSLLVGFALLMNLALLPLYGYQNYAYRHYIGFIFPLMWIAAGHAIVLLATEISPAAKKLVEHVRAHPGLYIGIAVLGVIGWNLGSKSPQDGNKLFARTAELLSTHWLATIFLFAFIAFHRWILRPPWFLRGAVLAFTLVYACYRPHTGIKRSNLTWFPDNPAVWKTLSERKGLVSSFALQGEVAWKTGRKNIPSPEWAMHIYSFKYDHDLEVEDLYIESAASLISRDWGPFSWMAPGFEGYQRLQAYPGHLPGYEVAFHDSATRGYAKYRVKPRPKASTVYRLSNRDAVMAMRKSPERIELGEVANVVYTANGWGAYVEIDGKRATTGTQVTRNRYPAGTEAPWEDANVTFFLDQRVPKRAELDVYVPHATTVHFYFNLDLYYYDKASDRASHLVGTLTTQAAGWQHVVLELPPALAKRGLNKLGFRAASFQPYVLCPLAAPEDACARAGIPTAKEDLADPPALVLRTDSVTVPVREEVSLFATTLSFGY